MPTFGEKLAVVMKNAKAQAGVTWCTADFIRVADEFADRERPAKVPRAKKDPSQPKPPRPRNPLFDSLALATGTRDLEQLTKSAKRAIAVALADIVKVTPDLTVEEINRRAAAYRRRWTDPRNLSANALAKHWHEFAPYHGEAKTKAAMSDPYQEPEEPLWHNAAIKAYGFEVGRRMAAKGWHNIGTDFRQTILRELAAEQPVAL